MKRLFAVLALAVPLIAGCNSSQAQIAIYNGCFGSYLVIYANGEPRENYLPYGEVPFTLGVSHVGEGQVLVTAAGFSEKDNRPLGVATYGTIYVGNSSGPITGPNQYSWTVTSLTTSDPHGGCQPNPTAH